RLNNTIDLRGKTRTRDLIHLVYNARGIISGVTSLMHLAAAVPTENGAERQAVILGGAREPRVWEHYPGHEFISTEGEVECAHCWKHRCAKPGERVTGKRQEIVCTAISHELPDCMDRVSAAEVIGRIERILASGIQSPLSTHQAEVTASAVNLSAERNKFDLHNVTEWNAVEQANRFLASIPKYPERRFQGKGIVICGGGVRYFTNAWVCINVLRHHGCTLPIEVWHLGRKEFDHKMEGLLTPLGARCVNAREVMNRHPLRNPLGWELKSYAVLNSAFEEVLFLDADNMALRDPEFLFRTTEYEETGAIFWPDYRRLSRRRKIWKLCVVPYRDEPEFESGQMVIHKRRCWKALNLAFWYNDHSEFFYQHIHGDKETFHLAWRRLNLPYTMVPYPIQPLRGTMCQHDLKGCRLFQHRNLAKWEFFAENQSVPGFELEELCLEFVSRLRGLWDGKINHRRELSRKNGFVFRKGTFDENIYRSVVTCNEYALPDRLEADDVVVDVGGHIGSFSAACHARGSRSIHCFEPNSENYSMAKENLSALEGVRVSKRALLHREGAVKTEQFPLVAEGENTGGAAVSWNLSGETKAASIDEVLKKLQRVTLLKLDCEGSEWPILTHAKELHRAENVCGEFHEVAQHELCPGAPALNRKLLRKLLKKHFHWVETVVDRANPELGKFWASTPKNRQADAGASTENRRSLFEGRREVAGSAPRGASADPCGP
ncbi:MAG TPA: FkbM family methyltransferase, partial [Verrucomicrobiae bacterium]|nr:FkbM family methyltransferase [Verrucomicrobiae bacterium]